MTARFTVCTTKATLPLPHSCFAGLLIPALFTLLACVTPVCDAATPPPIRLKQRGPDAPTVVLHRDDRVATLDLDFERGNPWTPFDIGEDGLGPVGYRVMWRSLVGNDRVFKRKVTSLRRVQIQPLLNNSPYFVRVEYVNRFGNVVGDFAAARFNGGSGSRVATLRQQMTGFFDDFNQPAGLPDERKWNTTFSKINDPNLQAFFINSQFHAHTLVGTLAYGFGDRGQTVHRVRNPLQLGEGETRRIVFDLDGVNVGSRAIWYLDLLPEESEITSHFTLGGGAGSVGQPGSGLRFSLIGQEVAVWTLNDAGEQILIEKNNSLDFDGVQTFPNVRRSFEILVTENHVTVFIDDVMVLDANLVGDEQLVSSEYTVHWTAFGYNTMKVNMPYFLLHWDNFGFDGPPPTHVVHNYRSQVAGTDYVQSDNFELETVNVNIPDDLNPATGVEAEARLVFTRQMQDWQIAKWSPFDTVMVGGTAYAIPEPVSNTNPPQTLDELINVNAAYSSSIPLGTVGEEGTAPLVRGQNNVTFAADGCGFHNVHIEVKYPRGSEPAYTPPQDLHSVPLHHDFIKVGLPARITRIGDSEVDRNVWGMNEPEQFNATVRDTVSVGMLVNGYEAFGPTTLDSDYVSPQLAGSGENPGISLVRLWIRPNGGDAASATLLKSIKTRSKVAAPQFVGSFDFDTTEFPNGVYELSIVAKDSRGVLSIPDFGGVGRQAGSPEALNGFYFPLHITIDN